MAWNKVETKDVASSHQKGAIGPGAPIVYNQSLVGRPYRDGWNVERAFTEGVQKVTWAFRAIDVIASNQARLPMVLRKDNSATGEIVPNHKMLKVFNSVANVGENSFVFRYRLSSQVLLSTRGAFVEIVRGRDGGLVALHLLPPQSTSPIPHPRNFVSHYEVDLPDGTKRAIRRENVVWIRRPHPLDPYRSLTPLEAAGLAIEIENLARLYNRNFLLNDGRPGGLLVIRGELSPEDRNELQSRFRGDLNRSGKISVISSDDGAEFIDTGASPRDASYVEQRRISKEEILAAFGVPESVIGNASGRTFSNAAEEGRVFWMETMLPHLDLIARGLDSLDEQYYIDFDTTKVPILILAKQDRERYLLTEFGGGVISANEYRDGTDRPVVKSELADALLANPNLTAIGNTKKEMKVQPTTNVPPGAPLDVQSGETPVQQFPPSTPTGGTPPPAGDTTPPPADTQKGMIEGVVTKEVDWTDVMTKSVQAADRWETITALTLDRFFGRQERVVLEKVNGKRTRHGLGAGSLVVSEIFKAEVWDKQLVEDLRPVLQGIVADVAGMVAVKVGTSVDLKNQEIQDFLDMQMRQAVKVNDTTRQKIAVALSSAALLTDEHGDAADVALKVALLTTAVKSIFAVARSKRKKMIAADESLAAYNAGLFFARKQAGLTTKTWLTRGDALVRPAHRILHGESVPLGSAFKAAGHELRFPKDPLAPADLTIGCRCFLSFE